MFDENLHALCAFVDLCLSGVTKFEKSCLLLVGVAAKEIPVFVPR